MEIFPFLIPITIFLCTTYIVKIAVDASVRKTLIEKDMLNENTKYLYSSSVNNGVPASLKWGMVCIAIGLAFIFAPIIEAWTDHLIDDDALTFALMFIFGGIALIVYYFMGKRYQSADE